MALTISLDASAPSVRFADDVRAGLTRAGQKELPSKYLYDAVGSALFEAITFLPEYGLTRAGERLIHRHAEEILSPVPGSAVVAELGSGSARNTRTLLEVLARRGPVTYCPIDISMSALTQAGRELDRIDSVTIVGFEAEYLDGLRAAVARRQPDQALLVLFLGSTIGNFDREAGSAFLGEVRRLLQPGDRLLLATDMEKEVERLVLAYDDPAGVTAAFNRNLLVRINRELGGDFILSRFRHVVRWNAHERRIEMHLASLQHQTVRVPAARQVVEFDEGETIWTESSHKFRDSDLAGFAERLAFRIEGQWLDAEWSFAQTLYVAE